MTSIQQICDFLAAFAPTSLAEDWDNVGLLVGDPARSASRVMTCLTVTPSTAAEAVAERAELVVSHHPVPFRPLKRLTTESATGRLLLELIGGSVAVYSPHTAFDSAARGINQRLAEGLGLVDVQPLVPTPGQTGDDVLGSGRFGHLPAAASLEAVAQRLKQFLGINGLHVVGPSNQSVQRVAVACGSAGQFLAPARQAGCDLLVTGETGFHTCLEAEASQVALLLPGHFASERFAVEQLADVLAERFDDLSVWASRDEVDPLRWI